MGITNLITNTVKSTLEYTNAKPVMTVFLTQSSAAISILAWCSYLSPIVAFLTACVGLLIGVSHLVNMWKTKKNAKPKHKLHE